MSIQIETYILPEYCASYAINGEPSGDDDLDTAYDAWLKHTMSFHGWKTMHCVDVTSDQGFMRYHELHDFDVGSCDTETFTFHVTS